jgi:hypothetical protein
MNTSEQVLVVVLSSFLAIFLLLGIIGLIKTIQILNILKRISDKAEKLTDKAEAVGDFFQKTAGTAALAKLLSNIVHTVKSGKHERKEYTDER